MKIVVVGCGYLGMDIAAFWKKKGHAITVTTRSAEKLEALSKISRKSILLRDVDEETLAPLLIDHDLIIIALAADSPEQYEHTYLHTSQAIKHLSRDIEESKTLIYISSTSVYGDHQGQWVDEESPLLAKGDQTQILIEAENNYLLLQELGWSICILRLAELYGPGRELSKRVRNIEGHVMGGSGDQYSNMVHQKDASAAMDYVLRHHLDGIYNVADDEHPTRKELYDAVSKKFSLPKAKWDPQHTSLHQGNKRVSNHKIKAEGFAFHHPHRVLD